MASDSSEESEAKRPVDALDVRVLSVAGEVLLRLSARRDWKLTRLKEFLEAALKMPKLTQRLLHGQEVLEDQSVLGSCVQDCDPRLDLTLVRQKPPVDSLMQQAMLGNGSSCLTLLQLPEALELVNFTEEMSPLSCLQAAALMRLNATCLEILKMPGFRLVNQADILRKTALHQAVDADLPQVCSAILKRPDFTVGCALAAGESALHLAIISKRQEAAMAMVPLASREMLLQRVHYAGFMESPNNRLQPEELATLQGLPEVAAAIRQALEKSRDEAG